MNSIIWGFVIYVIAFLFAIIGLIRWRSKRRNERPPQAFKLLRGPGEHLRKRMAKFDEDFDQWVWGLALLPVLLASGIVVLANKTFPGYAQHSFYGAVVVLFGGLVAAGATLYGKLRRYRDDRLGYLGERAVAEQLEPLLAERYRIFHDVPFEGRKSDYNIDHVVVGPTGVFAIETKTYRKRRPVTGRKDHEVTFDGHSLDWPWGWRSREEIDQAVRGAEDLRKWIKQRLGVDVSVGPILTLPGWWVNEKPSSELRVVPAKWLPKVIRGRGERILSDDQIDLIARQLDLVCRDVED